MLAAAVILFRFLQYSGAMILLGSSLFFLYGLPGQGPCAAVALSWPKRLLNVSAVTLLIGAVFGVVSQTGVLVGSLGDALQPDTLKAALTQMDFGISAVVRAVAAAALLLCLIVLPPSRPAWLLCTAGGALVCTSLAWMGHGAATEGPAGFLHLFADIIHALAASVWIGALVAFLFLLLWPGRLPQMQRAIYQSLRRFSGIGSLAVALIVLSGLVNSWFLIGPGRLLYVWTTLYGQVLLAKLLAFAAMLGLAASNRYRLTPALGEALDARLSDTEPLNALRRSLFLETAAAFAVLALVAWLGTLQPPHAG